ncbi:MAG: NTP transferase domain-containing protein [Actinomycetales bacterium]
MSDDGFRGHTAPPPAVRWDAVVLCGGQGRRFGSDKIVAPLQGRPLLTHVLHSCASASHIWLLGPARANIDLPPSAAWHPDPVPNAGPLSALVAFVRTVPRDTDGQVQTGATSHAGLAPWVAVLAGDMPGVGPVLQRLLAAASELAEPGQVWDGVGCAMTDRQGRAGVAPMPLLLRRRVLLDRVAATDLAALDVSSAAPAANGLPLRRLLDGLRLRTVAEQPADVDDVRDLAALGEPE